MHNDTILSACPVVDHEHGTFARIFDVSDVRGIFQVVPFESDVMWLREGHYKLGLFSATGKPLKDGCATGDYHDFLTAYPDPFTDAANMAAEFDVDPNGPNTVEVRMTVIERPVYAIDDPIGYRNAKMYRPIPGSWLRYDPSKIDEWREVRGRGDFYHGFDFIETRTVLEATIWNSRLGLSNSAQFPALRAAIERALTGVDEKTATDARSKLEQFINAKLAA